MFAKYNLISDSLISAMFVCARSTGVALAESSLPFLSHGLILYGFQGYFRVQDSHEL